MKIKSPFLADSESHELAPCATGAKDINTSS